MAGPLTAELSARAVIAPGIAELAFTMRSPERLVFRAGQFVSLALPSPSDETAGMIPRRSYSIASQSSAGDVLRFFIRVIPEGKASDYLMALPLGTTVNLTGPHGFFVLDPVHAGDVVFAATGTGIAAVMPMLGELAQAPAGERRRVIIYWGLRQQSDMFARDEIDALAARRRRRAGDPPHGARAGLDGRPGTHHAGAARPAAPSGGPDVLSGGKRRHDHRAEARADLARREPQDPDPDRSVLRLASRDQYGLESRK